MALQTYNDADRGQNSLPAQIRFDVLSENFSRLRPAGPPVGRKKWFKCTWYSGTDSINDLLVRTLIDYGYEYIRTVNGDIWALYNGNWINCEYEIDGDEVQFYALEYMT